MEGGSSHGRDHQLRWGLHFYHKVLFLLRSFVVGNSTGDIARIDLRKGYIISHKASIQCNYAVAFLHMQGVLLTVTRVLVEVCDQFSAMSPLWLPVDWIGISEYTTCIHPGSCTRSVMENPPLHDR